MKIRSSWAQASQAVKSLRPRSETWLENTRPLFAKWDFRNHCFWKCDAEMLSDTRKKKSWLASNSFLNTGVAPECLVRSGKMPWCCTSALKKSVVGGGGRTLIHKWSVINVHDWPELTSQNQKRKIMPPPPPPSPVARRLSKHFYKQDIFAFWKLSLFPSYTNIVF